MPPEAVLTALRHVWLTLQPLGLPMAVMGGLALAAWKYVRATRDVDILVGISPGRIDRVLEHLCAAGVRPKREPPVASLGQLEIAQLLYEPPEAFLDLQIDLLLGKSAYHDEALRRRIPLSLPGLDIPVAVLTCEDLILHKLLAGRIIDRADAAALLRANRAELDLAYLRRWIDGLRLAAEFREAWLSAFPGEDCPI